MNFRSRYLVLLFVLAALFMLSSVMAQADCPAGVDYLAQAETAYQEGDFSMAMQAYGCVLISDPFNDSVRVERLASAVEVGDYMTAYGDVFLLNNTTPQTILGQIAGAEEGQTKLRAFLAIFAVLPNYDLALSNVEHILAADPSSAFAYVIRAAAYEGLEDPENARSAFDQAVALAPDNAQVYGLMAAAQFSVFDIQGVRQNVTQAITLDPNIAQLYRLRGFTSMVMGDPEAVLEDANRAIELDPDYFAFYVLRGHAHHASGDPQSALADFDQVIALAPQSGFGYALRAELKLQIGDNAAAALDILTAMELETINRIDGAALVTDSPATIPMTFGRVYHLPFEAQQGDRLTLSAISTEPGAVDPVIVIVAPDGTPLIYNDDADVEADVLDAIIANFEAPADGTYVLMVSHARGGSEGNIEVLVAQP